MNSKLWYLGLGACVLQGTTANAQQASKKQDSNKPNVLFIVMDDMCDWAHYLGGNNQVKTPNLDRLAARGVRFANAYTAVPLSNPSRTAMMTGLYPFVTGIYNNNQQLQDSPQVEGATLLPEHFKQNGYTTFWSGKIFHHKPSDAKLASAWDDMEYRDGGYGPWAHSTADDKGKARKGPKWDIHEAWTGPDTDFPDVVNSHGVIDFLGKKHDKPFFVAMGFYRPHTPHTAPKRYFDLYDLNSIERPRVLPDDLDDIPPYAVENFINLDKARKVMNSPDKAWEKEIWSYLACISFADDRIGMILDALDRSPYADNTVIVLVGDNGFHHGQKERFGKSALWREACHVPFIVCGPKNGAVTQGECEHPVGLIDIYPTLTSLCGLPEVANLNGNDLSALLADPQSEWDKPTISTFLPGNFTLHYGKWNYIRYADGSQELYDTQADEDEFFNRASDPEHKDLIQKLDSCLPTTWHPGVKPREIKHNTRIVFAK